MSNAAPSRLFSADVDHAEDLALTSDGNLVLAGERGQIYVGEIATRRLRKVCSTGGRGLGVAATAHNTAVVCDPRRGQLIHVDLGSGAQRNLLPAGFPTQHLNSVAFSSDGSAFISDSGSWGRDDGRIIVLTPDGIATVQSGDFNRFTNGLRVSPDDRYLYVVESRGGLSRALLTNGELGQREVVVELPGMVADGLAFCSDGSILVACYQPNVILRVDPEAGSVETLLRDDEGVDLVLPTNIAFYGDELGRLAIANLGARHITTVDLGLTGAAIQCPPAPTPSSSTREDHQ